MRKCIVVCLFLGCLLSSFAEAPKEERDRSGYWFPVGEVIVYRLKYLGISGGTVLVTSEWIEEDGRELIHIVARTESNKWLSKIYKVRDRMESYVDPDTFLPVRFVKNLSEGSYRAHEVTTFDHANGTAVMKSYTNEKEKEFEIFDDTRDLLSFMFYARGMEFKPGKKRRFQVMADEKVYDLDVLPSRTEKVKTVAGKKIKSLKMEPKAAFDGLFIRKGRMWLWVSQEGPRVLTRMVAEIPVASVNIILQKVIEPEGWTGTGIFPGQDQAEGEIEEAPLDPNAAVPSM